MREEDREDELKLTFLSNNFASPKVIPIRGRSIKKKKYAIILQGLINDQGCSTKVLTIAAATDYLLLSGQTSQT